MAKCPVCGNAYYPGTGKALTKNNNKLVVCRRCYSDRERYLRFLFEGNTEEAEKIYHNWLGSLERNCEDIYERRIILSALENVDETSGGFAEDGKRIMKERDDLRRKKEEEAARHKKAIRALKDRISSFKLTPGDSFEGYYISDYHGIVSAVTVLNNTVLPPTQTLWDDKGDDLVCNDEADHPLAQALSETYQRLAITVEKAGGNAGTGVKIDYIPYGSSTLAIAASAQAVSVKEK